MTKDDIPSTRELINNYISLAEKGIQTQSDLAKAVEKLESTVQSKLWYVIWALLAILAAKLGVDIGVIPSLIP